jgi:hypothetical protein
LAAGYSHVRPDSRASNPRACQCPMDSQKVWQSRPISTGKRGESPRMLVGVFTPVSCSTESPNVSRVSERVPPSDCARSRCEEPAENPVVQRKDVVEGVGHTHAFDRFLHNPVDHHRRLDARGFEDSWHDVDHVVELGADAAGVLDAVRPGDRHALSSSSEVR